MNRRIAWLCSMLFCIACLPSCFLPAVSNSDTTTTHTDSTADDFDKNQGQDINSDGSYNYTAALQKSLFFYDTERSGDLPNDFRVSWRGSSELCDSYVPLDESHTNLSSTWIMDHHTVLDPDENGGLDLSGGFHDAGDHVKFGLPQAYAASTLAWSYYEYADTYIAMDQDEEILSILRWFGDYFLRSTFLDSSGDVLAFAYQVGDGSIDHNYWGPPELQSCDDYPRPAWLATTETPASDQAAAASAALALLSLNFQDTDLNYAETCLSTAKALYQFAQSNRGLGDSGGFYSSSNDNDEMAWAAVWLYTATQDSSYLNDILSTSGETYTGYFSAIVSNTQDNWQNIWTHSWDTVWTGVILRLATITEDTQFQDMSRWNLQYWSGLPHDDMSDTNFIPTSPSGYAFLTIWGSARYNTTAQFISLLYDKYFGGTQFSDWAQGQMNYLMGDNPLERSYIVGFTDSYAAHPHHRAAHASLTNSMSNPSQHKHILYGALVGGPDDQDAHIDETSNYIYNEVAIDYNAGFTGALVGLAATYGFGDMLQGFPVANYDSNPIYAQAELIKDNNQTTQLKLTLVNESYFPPQTEAGLSMRYYFSVEELNAVGQDISDVNVDVYYDEGASLFGEGTEVSEPIHDSDDLYYIEISWADWEFHGSRNLELALSVDLADDYDYHWDSSNDFSFEGISTFAETAKNIPVYQWTSEIF